MAEITLSRMISRTVTDRDTVTIEADESKIEEIKRVFKENIDDDGSYNCNFFNWKYISDHYGAKIVHHEGYVDEESNDYEVEYICHDDVN
jgi:hypothetical protein